MRFALFCIQQKQTTLSKDGTREGEIGNKDTRVSPGKDGQKWKSAPGGSQAPFPSLAACTFSFSVDYPSFCVTRWASVALFLSPKWAEISLAAARGQHESLCLSPRSYPGGTASISGPVSVAMRNSWYTLTSIHLYAMDIDCGGELRGEKRGNLLRRRVVGAGLLTPPGFHTACVSHSVISGLLSFSSNKRTHAGTENNRCLLEAGNLARNKDTHVEVVANHVKGT